MLCAGIRFFYGILWERPYFHIMWYRVLIMWFLESIK